MINYAKFLARKGTLDQPMWFNLLLGSLGTIPAGTRDLLYLVESLPEHSSWGVAGTVPAIRARGKQVG